MIALAAVAMPAFVFLFAIVFREQLFWAALFITFTVATFLIEAARRIFLWKQFGDMHPVMVRLLHEHGYLFCRSCFYDLRGLDAQTEDCPECGVYISRRIADETKEPPPILEHRQQPFSKINQVVRGGQIATADIEAAMIAARNQRDNSSKLSKSATRAALIIACLMTVIAVPLVMSYMSPQVSQHYIAMLAAGVVLLIMIPNFWIGARNYSRFLRDTRSELRNEGHEICIKCGRFLGDCDPSVTHCISCKAQREAMPQQVTNKY
jgi:hypothetical protein